MELVLLCVKVFFARILDVSIGTFRTLGTVKGKTFLAAVLGFTEVFIWFVVVKDALNTNIDSIFIPLSYSLGYATGTFLGGKLAEKFITGNLTMQVVLSGTLDDVVNTIREKGYAATVLNVKGQEDVDKYMLFMEINKKKLNEVKHLIKELDSKAFIVVNETKLVQNGYLK